MIMQSLITLVGWRFAHHGAQSAPTQHHSQLPYSIHCDYAWQYFYSLYPAQHTRTNPATVSDLKIDGATVQGQWDIACAISISPSLDGNGNGEITWGELRARHDAIGRLCAAAPQDTDRGETCPLHATEHLVDNHSDGAMRAEIYRECVKPLTAVDVNYSLLFDVDPQHKGLLRLEYKGTTTTGIFSPDKASQHFEFGRAYPVAPVFWTTPLKAYGISGSALTHPVPAFPATARRAISQQKNTGAVAGLRPALIVCSRSSPLSTLAHSIT